jgi:hypothetical protein
MDFARHVSVKEADRIRDFNLHHCARCAYDGTRWLPDHADGFSEKPERRDGRSGE